jgi:hypothetical protein
VPDRVGLPDVDRGALHGAARRGVDDRDAQDQRHARAVSDDVRANPVQRDVERPDLLFRRQGARRRGDGLLDGGAEQLRTAEEHGARASRVASCTQRARRRRDARGMVICMLVAGASYALISSLAQALGPRRPD